MKNKNKAISESGWKNAIFKNKHITKRFNNAKKLKTQIFEVRVYNMYR